MLFGALGLALPASALAQPVGPDEPPEVVSPDEVKPKPPPAPVPPPTAKPATPAPAPAPEEGDDDDDEGGVPEEELGEEGESCQKRADCRSGLKCVDQQCVDPDKPPPKPEPVVAPAPPPPPEPEGDSEWMAFDPFSGTHFFGGLSFGPGFSAYHNLLAGSFGDVEGSFIFSLRGGVLLDGIEIALELSPVTYVPYLASGDPMLQLNATGGTYLHLFGDLYWPLRAGIGLMAVNAPPPADALLQIRADLIGVAYKIGHLIVEANLPSYRFGSELDRYAIHSWLFSLGGSYVF